MLRLGETFWYEGVVCSLHELIAAGNQEHSPIRKSVAGVQLWWAGIMSRFVHGTGSVQTQQFVSEQSFKISRLRQRYHDTSCDQWHSCGIPGAPTVFKVCLKYSELCPKDAFHKSALCTTCIPCTVLENICQVRNSFLRFSIDHERINTSPCIWITGRRSATELEFVKSHEWMCFLKLLNARTSTLCVAGYIFC